ncbi:MAG: glycosyltransferase family 4 protein [Bacteroidota bacterium]|nr:glycosyltransferase family 4 protein [Bacteroidota bacterium]
MKVAVLAPVAWRTPPRHYGPWEQVASNIAEGLLQKGIDVTVFATGDSITAGKLEAICEKGYEENRDQDAKVLECLHISNLMEKASQFDIIHNNFDFLPLTYSALIKRPIITTIHGFSSQKIIPVYKKYNSIGHYVSISDADRSAELNYLATVYNGLNVNDFELSEVADDYLLYFGRIHPDKGTAEAIEISKRSNRKLLIAGLVQDTNYFKEKIEPQLSSQIEYLGNAEPQKRKSLLGKAAALLHPISFNEPFGMSVAEAMLCGTPVIAFNKGAMPELIKDGETGYLVSNIGEAVNAVGMLKNIRRIDCHKWAAAKFSSERMVSDYLVLYKQILER